MKNLYNFDKKIEFIKCKNDVIYFFNNYLLVESETKLNIKQEIDFLESLKKYGTIISNEHESQSVNNFIAGYSLWNFLFNGKNFYFSSLEKDKEMTSLFLTIVNLIKGLPYFIVPFDIIVEDFRISGNGGKNFISYEKNMKDTNIDLFFLSNYDNVKRVFGTPFYNKDFKNLTFFKFRKEKSITNYEITTLLKGNYKSLFNEINIIKGAVNDRSYSNILEGKNNSLNEENFACLMSLQIDLLMDNGYHCQKSKVYELYVFENNMENAEKILSKEGTFNGMKIEIKLLEYIGEKYENMFFLVNKDGYEESSNGIERYTVASL